MTAGAAGLPIVQSLRRLRRRVLDGWDRALLYLPTLLMLVLALGTYWLVRTSPASAGPEPGRAPRHESDYFMRRFTLKTFDEGGLLKSEVQGLEARHYPDTDTLEIDQPRIRSINPQGRVTISSGNRALSNGDGSEVQLMGNARVVRDAVARAAGGDLPRMEFQGEFLHVFANEDRVRSHLPVVLIRGADRFAGDTLAYDNLSGVANLTGRVRGVLMPGHGAAAPARR